MDDARSLRRTIEELQSLPWNRQDKEALAACYLRLEHNCAVQLSTSELETAAKYCLTACYAAIYATGNLEFVFPFAAATREFNSRLPLPNSLRTISSYLAESIALRHLGKDWLRPLRLAIRTRARARRKAPQGDKDLQEKTVLILWGLALYWETVERPERAISVARKAVRLLGRMRDRGRVRRTINHTQKQLKADKILGLLLLRHGNVQEALDLFARYFKGPNTPPKICLDVAEVLLNSEGEQARQAARPYYEQAIGYYTQLYRDKGRVEMRAWFLLLQDAVTKDDLKQAEAAFNVLQQVAEQHQLRFLYPDNLDGFLGRYDSMYGLLINLYWKHGLAKRALYCASLAFWNTVRSRPEHAADSYDLDRTRLAEQVLLAGGSDEGLLAPSLTFPLTDGRSHLIFFCGEDACYRFLREQDQLSWDRIPVSHRQLEQEVCGLRSLCGPAAQENALFRITRSGLHRLLFSGLEEKLATAHRIQVTVTSPLTRLPWSLFAEEHVLCIHPGQMVRVETQQQTGLRLLSVADNGGALPMAAAEQHWLQERFPAEQHLSLDMSSPPADRHAVLDALQDCNLFHFAGHGLAHPNRPELSGLVLYGEPPALPSGAVLTLEEIRSLDLSRLRLAVINSCSSGYGVSFAGEMQVHAAAAFLDAGAGNLIVSVREIGDRASARFTRDLYTNLLAEPEKDMAEIFYRTCRQRDRWQRLAAYVFLGG